MATLRKKFIGANQVDGTKIRLSNAEYLRARNAADSADINVVRVNSSNEIEFPSVPKITGTPSASNDAATVGYVQSVLEGLDPKEAVRVASVGSNINLASELENGDSLDGVTLATGDRVLVKDQSDQTQNGIYVVQASGAAVRSSDMNASAEFVGAYTLVRAGTVNQGRGYVCSVPSSFTLGSDNGTFVLFKAAADFVGGDGITITGNTIDVDLSAASGLEFSSGELQVNLEASNPTLQISSNELCVKLDPAGAIVTGSNGLAVQQGDGLAISANTLAVDLAATPGLEFSGGQLRAKVDAATVKRNASGELEALKHREQKITLAGGDITNQYVDLAFAAFGADATNNSLQLAVIGGIIQEKGVDYTVSLTGGSGGVTRVTFAGDLATGGNAALVAGDILVINYSYLT